MKTIIKSVVVVLLVLPNMVFAATKCRVTEYPDHFEAVCIGDEQPEPLQKQAPVQTPRVNVTTSVRAQTVEAAKSSDAQQLDAMNQEFTMVPIIVPNKKPAKDQTLVSSQKDDVAAPPVQSKDDVAALPVQFQRNARTTALEAAIAARRKLIMNLQ